MGDSEPLVSIIIPYLNHWELVHSRIMDVYRFSPDSCELILVDDESTDEDCSRGVAWWQKGGFYRHKIRYYRNPVNIGFGGSCNNGAKLAKGKLLVFLSSDVIMYRDIISDIAILTSMGADNKMLLGGRIIDWPGGWNEFDVDGVHYVVPYAEGWFLSCTKIAWKEMGGFDPRYGKFDYEDVDLSTTALSLGYNIVALSGGLQHLGGKTISSLDIKREDVTRRNRAIYEEKWLNKLPYIPLFRSKGHGRIGTENA